MATAKRSCRPEIRRLARDIHLVLALAIGLVLAASGLTGSILVFRSELDMLLHPELLRVAPRPGPFDVDAALAAAAARFPTEPVRLVRLPRAPGETYELWIGDEPPRRLVYVDPYEARILGWRGEHDGLLGVLRNLHEHLLAGDAGATALGIVGLLTLLLLASGAILWAPRRGDLRRAFALRLQAASPKPVYDLHRLVGFLALPLLLLSALTGAALVFHRASAGLLVAALGGPALSPPPKLAGPDAEPPLPAAELLARAEAILPEATATWIQPGAGDRPFVVRLRFPETAHPNGMSYVALDPRNGAVLAAHSERAAGAGQAAADLRYPLHIGAAFGLIGRIAIAVAGAAPAALLVTGLLFWRARRPARRTFSLRRDGASAARSAADEA